MKRLILTAGVSGGGTLKAMRVSGDVVGCYESFVTGPLVAIEDFDALRAARIAYWNSIPMPWFDGPRDEWLLWGALYPAMVDRLRAADHVEIWVGADSWDTAFSVFAPLYLTQCGVPVERISVRRFHPDKGFGLGVLGEAELDPPADAVALGAEELQRLSRVWGAMCEISQNATEIADPDVSGLEARLLRALRGRWPDPVTGLTNIQRYLLEDAPTERKKAAYFVGHALGQGFDKTDNVGDSVLFEELKKMGNPAFGEPMFEIFGIGHDMRKTEAVLTPVGRAKQALLR